MSKYKVLTITIPPELADKVKKEADKMLISSSAYIRIVLSEALGNQD